jgi:type I restriction enzyme S subunit
LALEIPLPPLEEQRRLVATLDALSTKVAEARSLRESGAAERRRLLSAMAHRADLSAAAKAEQGWRRVKLGDVLSQVTDEHAVRTDGSYPNLGIYSYARGLFPKPPIEGLATSATKLNRVRNGQFIYSRLFAFEGAYGMVGPAFDGCFVSGEYPAFECDQSSITPEFLVAYFQAPTAWAEVAAGSKGLGHRRQRVQPGHLLNHVLELPPRDWQDRIAAVMREGQEVGALSAALGKQLDALMPTILHRAFRGEL